MTKKFNINIHNYSLLDAEDPDFLKVRLQVIKEGLTLNESTFTLEGMSQCKDTFKGKPLLCAFPKGQIGDAHNSDVKLGDEGEFYYSYLDPSSERCVGCIPFDSIISIEEINGENWITMTALIWKKYNYELVKDIIKKKRRGFQSKLSVEIEATKSFIENGIEYIMEWIGDGVTILNDKTQEAVVGANLKAYAESNNFEKYKTAMCFAYDKKSTEDLSVIDNDVSRVIDATYINNGLNKDTQVGKEEYMTEDLKKKMCSDGYIYVSHDTEKVYSFKDGKFHKFELSEDADAEVKYEEMSDASIKFEIAIDDAETKKFVDMDMDAFCNSLEEMRCHSDEKVMEEVELAKSEMAQAILSAEDSKVKMEEAVLSAEESKLKMEEAIKEKEEMAKKISDMEENIRMAEKEELAEKVKTELSESNDLDDDDKKEIMEKVEKNEYSNFSMALADIAIKTYAKKKVTKKDEFKYSLDLTKNTLKSQTEKTETDLEKLKTLVGLGK